MELEKEKWFSTSGNNIHLPLHNTKQYDIYKFMIKSFNHKGLKKFFTTGSKAGITPQHSKKLKLILQALHTAMSLEDMNIPGWRLHPLTGDKAGKHAVWVSGNWRVFFEFIDGHAYVVDYNDYH